MIKPLLYLIVCFLGLATGAQAQSLRVRGVDVDTVVYLSQIAANGCAAPTAAFINDANTLIVSDKVHGNWSSRQFLYLLAGVADECTAKINVREPWLYGLTFSGTYSWATATGFDSDGTSGFADTGVNQTGLTMMAQNNAHISAWALNKGNFQLGLAGTSSGLQISPGGSTKATRLTSATTINDTSLAGYNWADRTTSATIVTGNNASVQTAAGAATSAVLLANHIVLGKANASFMPVNTHMIEADGGAALPNETAAYADLRAFFQARGVAVP